MAKKVFINLPVEDLDKSVSFFTDLGFSFNPHFTDESSTCMIVSDNIFVMLLSKDRFQTYTKKQVVDTKLATEVLIALDSSSREEVQQMIKTAEKSGATIYAEAQDHGWMYQHSFADLDGHQWELIYMDESQMPNQ